MSRPCVTLGTIFKLALPFLRLQLLVYRDFSMHIYPLSLTSSSFYSTSFWIFPHPVPSPCTFLTPSGPRFPPSPLGIPTHASHALIVHRKAEAGYRDIGPEASTAPTTLTCFHSDLHMNSPAPDTARAPGSSSPPLPRPPPLQDPTLQLVKPSDVHSGKRVLQSSAGSVALMRSTTTPKRSCSNGLFQETRF